MFVKHIDLNNEKDTKEIAIKIAPILEKGDCIALYGDLGAGKTSFSRSLIQYLSNNQEQIVPSPTFTLVQFYELKDFTLWHFDLYRIKNQEEVYELGWEEAHNNGVTIIEWPENLGSLLPENRLEINLFFKGHNDDSRTATIKAFGEMEEKIKNTFF